MIETDTIVLPAFLASALINGDVSGIEDSPDDMAMLRAVEGMLTRRGWSVVSCEGEPYFARYPAWLSSLSGDVLEYTVLYEVAP